MKIQGGRIKEKPPRVWLLRVFENFGFRLCDPAGTRTQDPYIKSVLLYQLSYGIIRFGVKAAAKIEFLIEKQAFVNKK